MKHKNSLLFIVGVMLCGAVVFGSADRSSGDDGFYVIPVTNRNIKMVDQNTALGIGALQSNTNGNYNTASGHAALYFNTTGSMNIGLGSFAGAYFGWGSFTGSNNIYIGYAVEPAAADESDTIRIGNDWQSRTFIKGISGITVPGGVAVYVKSDGQLGTSSSSRRFKQDIRDMGDATSGLMRLRPVTFHYKPEYAGGPHTLQYGLIAEEVAEVYPELVQYDPKSGEPQTVYYHFVNAMLLNEVQKQQHQILAQNEEISDLNKRLARLEAFLDK